MPFRLDPVRPGVFEGTVRLDLAGARLPLGGFAGVRHPLVRLAAGGQSNQALLLAPLDFPPLTARVPYRSGAAPHQVTVEPEGHNPGRLQIRWQPAGAPAALRPLATRLVPSRLRRAVQLVAGAVH